MGIYINPKNMSKEQFLLNHGEEVFEITPKAIWDKRPGGSLPVVLVNNGPFTAAGVCDSLQELSAFLHPGDHRPKTLFYVKIQHLLEGEVLLPGDNARLRRRA